MWSKRARAGVDRGRRPAPRTPSKNELRPDYEGWSRTAVQARSNLVPSGGAGWSKRSNLSLTLTRKRVKGNRWESTWTGWTGHDREASRSRVPAQRAHRSRAGSAHLEARRRGALLAVRSTDRAWDEVRRRSPEPGRRTLAVEPRGRVRAVQPTRRWTDGRRDHERSTSSISTCRPSGATGSTVDRWACAVVIDSRAVFFAGRCNPRLRLQEQLFPLKGRAS